jgi:hypothetical protein
LDSSESDPRFQQQMAYAVVMKVIETSSARSGAEEALRLNRPAEPLVGAKLPPDVVTKVLASQFVYLLSGVEAVLSAAVGWLFGKEVHRE